FQAKKRQWDVSQRHSLRWSNPFGSPYIYYTAQALTSGWHSGRSSVGGSENRPFPCNPLSTEDKISRVGRGDWPQGLTPLAIFCRRSGARRPIRLQPRRGGR